MTIFTSVGNMPYSYILPHPFDPEVEDNYVLGNLWPYLFSLLEAPSILKYIGCNPRGQQQIARKDPHWLVLKAFAWSSNVA
jgi:hypothetical protein